MLLAPGIKPQSSQTGEPLLNQWAKEVPCAERESWEAHPSGKSLHSSSTGHWSPSITTNCQSYFKSFPGQSVCSSSPNCSSSLQASQLMDVYLGKANCGNLDVSAALCLVLSHHRLQGPSGQRGTQMPHSALAHSPDFTFSLEPLSLWNEKSL